MLTANTLILSSFIAPATAAAPATAKPPAQPAPTTQARPQAQQPSPTRSSSPAPARPQKTPMGTEIGLGASAGMTSGIGLSLRRHFDSRFGFHVGAIGVWTLSDKRWANVGVQGLYTLRRSRKARLYALLGAQLFLTSEPLINRHRSATNQGKTKHVWNPTLAVGPGIGIEVHFTKHFGWAFEVPLPLLITLGGTPNRLLFEGKVNFIPALNTAFTFYF